ncbi:MAG: protein translocase subunit SecF [archaeon]|nr:protein translocase subunit SecF [archaeon]
MKELRQKIGSFHNKYYKLLLIIPISIILFCLIYMSFFYSQHHDFIYKDISLTGGSVLTVYESTDIAKLKVFLQDKISDASVKEVYDFISREQKAVIIETRSDKDQLKKVAEEYFGHELNETNSSFEFTGSSLSESFYNQLLIAIFVSFILMSLVVFIIFRTFVPSFAVITCVFADILMPLTLVNILGIELSSAGIVAFLMLIGYSVDTDILLTTRLLKRIEGSINERIFGAFKTGITMTLTSIFAVLVALIIIGSYSSILSQIFTILVIGLFFDIFNTWITNVSILKWYMEKKNKHEN